MAFVVYRPEEIIEFKNAVGKYICIQGKIYSVSDKVSKEEFQKEFERRTKLPSGHIDLEMRHLISLEDEYYICTRQYFNGL